MDKRLFVHFSEMTPAWINREMHLHTNYTDGKASIEEILARAEILGLNCIAFTEHVRKNSTWFAGFSDEVRRLRRNSKIKTVLVGAEVRITDFNGTLDISEMIREKSDFIIASVHRFPDVNGNPMDFSAVRSDLFALTEFQIAMGFIRKGGAQVLGHPGGMSVRHVGHFPDKYLAELASHARKRNIAIEINSSYISDMKQVLGIYRKINPMISISSDAHQLEELGQCRDTLRKVLWISESTY
jgi:putative hydrolase